MPMCTRNAIAALVYIWIRADVYPGMLLQRSYIYAYVPMCTLECNCSIVCITHLVRVANNDVGVLVWPAYLVQAGYVGGVHV